jgi:hypothetical protein
VLAQHIFVELQVFLLGSSLIRQPQSFGHLFAWLALGNDSFQFIEVKWL